MIITNKYIEFEIQPWVCAFGCGVNNNDEYHDWFTIVVVCVSFSIKKWWR